MSFLEALRARAAASPRRIGFPEADEERTAAAIRRLGEEQLVEPVRVEASGGVDALVSAARLLAEGRVDGVVAGARAPTAAVVRAALRTIGPAPGIGTVSSSFYMTGMARDPSRAGVLTFTDAGVVPAPSPEQMAEIGAAAADARRSIVGDEPRVAFLSYATRGSAEGEQVCRVREATVRFRELRPDVPADGELQADAALVAAVGERKAPGSPVAGRANVLVFPDLGAGNIAYKLVERLAGAEALGPILQGLALPMNDLSRGASVEDIVHVACITAMMAGCAESARAGEERTG